MKVKIHNQNNISKKLLIKKLKEEGKGKFYNIDQILSYKKPKIYKIQKIDDKNYKEEESHNQAYNESLKIFRQFNNKFKKGIEIYNSVKNENNEFIKEYRDYKNDHKRMFIKDTKQKNFIFGSLLNSYKKKGIQIPPKILDYDVYKESGLLISKKRKIEEFFDQEINLKATNNDKGEKSVKFLKKLAHEVKKVYNKRMFNINNKSMNNSENTNKESLSYENDDNEYIKNELELKKKIKKEKYLSFFNRLHSNIKEIKKQEKENKRLKELIAYEEEKHKYINNSVNNDNKNRTTNFIEGFNFSNKKNKRNKNLSFYPISQNESKTIDNFFNNNKKTTNNFSNSYYKEVITSSTLIPKNFTILKPEKDEKTNKFNNNINNNFTLSSSNNNFADNKIKNLKLSHSCMNISDKNTISEQKISKNILKKRRLSAIKINTINNAYGIPCIRLDEIHKKRRVSFLPKVNFCKINTSSRNRSLESKKDIKKISIPKSNSQPNVLNKRRAIRQIYEQISKINYRPYKKMKNKDKIDNLYKSLYGDKIHKFDSNSSNKEIFEKYFNIKNQIVINEHKNNIYLRYKDFLPVETMNKLKRSNELNKELKENPLNYAQIIYRKKFMNLENKDDDDD